MSTISNFAKCYRFWWEWKTPTGYLAAVPFQLCWLYFGMFLTTTLLLAFAGFCWLFGAFATDIKRLLSDLNDDILNPNLGATQSLKLKKQLYDIIEFHCFTKQLSSLCYSFSIFDIKDFLIFCGQICISSRDSVSTFAHGILCSVYDRHLFCSFQFERGIYFANESLQMYGFNENDQPF